MPSLVPSPPPRPTGRARWPAVLAVVVLLATFAGAPIAPADASEVRLLRLPIHPDHVHDVTWTDTWGAPRGVGRSHIGVDMMGAKMIPLVAVRTATVTWGRFDNSRGSIIRLRDDEGWEYQYIHLNNDTPGTDDGEGACTDAFSARLCGAIVDGRFAPGTRVTEGETIGYLGDGGNAEETSPHLHFEMYRPNGSGVSPINPTPSVDAAKARLLESPSSAGSAPLYAEPGETGFADYLWFQIEGRYPSAAERTAFEAEVATAGVWSALAERVGEGSTAASLDRLYQAFFHRHPDSDGIRYWIRIRGRGRSVEDIAEWFAESDEFRLRYDGIDFGQFLDRLYLDVLGRAPDPNGKAYWLDLLGRGEVTRGTIMVYFTEGAELRGLTQARNEIVTLSLVRREAAPTADEVDAWLSRRSTSALPDAVAGWYAE